ncbi:DUF58 domain-containing protein [uncultured Vibrio sp.]|uniref:DUF58 domain-containing protein n=1 Tax=uncultured Vibrio sp. TaxID=114054 RepID=UPI0025E02F9E|nr:DUF58 domain-containing protein [uncultured Vibrio sp.]
MSDANFLQDRRLYVSVEQLVALQYKADAFMLKPNSKVSSLRSGHHLSQYRGRGLTFEEYRRYQAGDDVKDIDWRVTMRTRHPTIKVFNDEKDLPVILVVDQQLSMLFSSVNTMKSVIAAEVAALCAWQVSNGGDRIGAVIFNDHKVTWLPPKRSKQHLSQLIGELANFNQQLNFERSKVDTEINPLKQALLKASHSKIKGGLFVVLSDFRRFDEESKKVLRQLQQHNDVVGVQVFDPLERQLQGDLPSYLSSGKQQLQTPRSSSELAQKYALFNKERAQGVKTDFTTRSLPFIELTTDGHHLFQFQQALSQRVV